jgi:hypothetical protein
MLPSCLIQSFLFTTGMITTWINLNDLQTEGTFRWGSGEVATYFNWNGAADNNAGIEHCVQFWYYIAEWNDADCTNNFPFICETSLIVV